MSEATNRVLEAQLRRQKQHDKRQKEWESALKPTTIDGSGVLRQLGQQPVDNRQILPNTASLNRPIRPTSVPGGVVADWLPRVKVDVKEPVKREKLYPVFLLEEYFDYVKPPEPGPIIDLPVNRAEQRSWLYFNNGKKPTEIPFNDTWEFLATNTVTTPAGQRPNVPYSDYGLSVSAYELGGSGISPSLEVFTWYKLWNPVGSEPLEWQFFIFNLRAGEEFIFNSIPDTTGINVVRTSKVEIWVRSKQVSMISVSKTNLYLYHAIADQTSNDNHGIYYYEIPIRQKTLTTPTRFSDYPGFQGAADDWRREWPDVATQDPLIVPSNRCYWNQYDSISVSYSNDYRYSQTFDTDATQSQTITIYSKKILENSPSTCTIADSQKQYSLRYIPPDLTDFPMAPLTEFPGVNLVQIYAAVFTAR